MAAKLLFVTLVLVAVTGALAGYPSYPKPKPKPTPAPPKQPPSCGNNEVYSECGNNGCQNTCANPDIAKLCKAKCVCGCICAPGFLRNSKGVCVFPEDCDTCKANEVFSKCDNHKCRNTCEEPEKIFNCAFDAGCYPGCVCANGFLKNADGVCVPEADCIVDPKACKKPNEVWSDTGNDSCQKSCDTFGKNIACKPFPKEGCICVAGFIRNQNGDCVKPTDCENNICPEPNEEYSDCASPCNTCEVAVKKLTCNFLVCNMGCDCKKGYHRNSQNVCVAFSECDVCVKENEVMNKCGEDPCHNSCQEPNRLTYCSSIGGCNAQGCVCADGYLRDDATGECIPADQCKCEDPNAWTVNCPNPCPGGTCLAPKFADCKAPCKIRGCQCKDGYVKDSAGKCILLEECPSCKDPNEVYNEGEVTVSFCDAADQTQTGCACKNGFYYASVEDRTCIKKELCAKKCGMNEEYFRTGQCESDCTYRNNTKNTNSNRPGCYCKKGFLRDNGKCISPKSCKCPAFEYYTKEAPECPENCNNRKEKRSKAVKLGCACIKGFIRECNGGKCIDPSKCPKKGY